MKYKIKLVCDHCKKLINETKEIESKTIADKIYFDALLNPMLGWCNDCDSKPMPYLLEIEGIKVKGV